MFKVGDKVKRKENMWKGIEAYTLQPFEEFEVTAYFDDCKFPLVCFRESGSYQWDAAYFELAIEQKEQLKVSKFSIGDRVISVKNTPAVPEGFIGKVVEIGDWSFPVSVTTDDGHYAVFEEDELELLSRRLEGEIHNTKINAAIDEPEYTGGSSSYYKVDVVNPTTSDAPYQAECNDVIEALGLTFTEGNIFKAIWRIAADRNGKKKKGNNSVYDAEKVVFFAERLLIQEKSKEGK